MAGIYKKYDPLKKTRRILGKFFGVLEKRTLKAASEAVMQKPYSEQDFSKLPFMAYLFSITETELNTIAERLTNILFSLRSNAQHIYFSTISIIVRVDTAIPKLEAELTEKLLVIKQNFADKRDASTNRIILLRTSYKSDLDAFLKLPYHLIWGRVVLVIIISGGIAFGDVTFIGSSLEATGLKAHEKLLPAISISLSLLFAGIFLAEIVRETKIHIALRIFFALLLSILVYQTTYALGEFRSFLVDQNIRAGANLKNIEPEKFALLSLMLFVALALVHYLLWPSAQQIRENWAYITKKKQVQRTQKYLRKEEALRDHLLIEQVQEEVRVTQDVQKQIDALLQEKSEAQSKFQDSEDSYHSLFGACLSFYKQCNAHYKAMGALYIDAINNRREGKRDEILFLTIDTLPDIPNPFQDFQPLTYSEKPVTQKSKPIIKTNKNHFTHENTTPILSH